MKTIDIKLTSWNPMELARAEKYLEANIGKPKQLSAEARYNKPS